MGTRYGEQAQRAGAAAVRYYDSLPDALHDLHAGRIDAAYGDAPILSYHVAHIPNSHLRYVAEFHPPRLKTCASSCEREIRSFGIASTRLSPGLNRLRFIPFL